MSDDNGRPTPGFANTQHPTPDTRPFSPSPAPRQDAWRVIGPGGGGTMIGPTISPHDPNLVVEHCDMTGAYITDDGGLSWRMFNLRTVVQTFAFDPGDPDVLYAGNLALWRSDDRGRTWRMVWPDPARNTVERMRGDHADPVLITHDPSYPASGDDLSIGGIAVSPADSSHLYVAVHPRGDRPAALYESRDRGATWTCTATFGAERPLLLHLHTPPGATAPEVIWISRQSVQRRTGDTWESAPVPAGIARAAAGSATGSAAPTLYATAPPDEAAGSRGGVFVSHDGGATWHDATGALLAAAGWHGDTAPRLGAIACCALHPDTAYVGFQELRTGEGPDHLFNGIAKTEDGGTSWSVVHREANRPSENLEASWIEERARNGGPNIWYDFPESLGVAPTDPAICYATDLFRTYRTLNGGRTWQQVNSVAEADGRWTTRGLDVTTCYGVHFDPFDPRHLYITYTDIGLFQSPDGGASWQGATEGIPENWRNTTYWIELDPEVPGLLWGAFGFNHDLPRPKMWRGQDPANYQGGVAVSTDGGLHWTLTNTGMPQTAITHILLDPTSPVGRRTLYACGFGRGVYRSVDNGRTWTLQNAGIEFAQPFAWRLTRADDGTLYLVVARRAERGPAASEEIGALYRSTDGAENWQRMALPDEVTGPTALTLDPTDPSRMYLSAWGLNDGTGDDVGGGVYRSLDGGASWQRIFDEGKHVYDVTVDPADPRLLYLCGFDAAAWRSDDGGDTWTRLKGYNFKWGHRVVLDPVDRDRVYVATYGGSVWHGPATGDPDAIEDIVDRPLAR